MLIRASDLSLASRSERTVERRHEERVLAWVGDRPKGAAAGLADPVSISKAALVRAQAAFAEQRPSAATPGASASVGGASGASSASEADDPAEDPRTRVWRLLIEALTGEKIVAGKFHVDRRGAAGVTGQGAATGQGQAEAAPRPRVGWGVEADVRDTTVDVQEVSFAARGTVQTADGRTIDLAVGLSLRDERVTVTSSSLRAGDAVVKDPLVLHFAGEPAELAGTVDFDLDSDGAAERMAFVGQGSGVLALDANGKARPEDGGALFGARTGNGFAELAAYDQDKNGWIDEGDAVYQRLGVWGRDANGAERVRSLAEAGVGAISLGKVATRMDLRGSDGALEGRLQATGVYLAESGRAGLAQQIDLAVEELPVAQPPPSPRVDAAR